jgi:hypothetical protein
VDAEILVRDYLRRLEAEARGLPADRGAELVAEVSEHIELALAEAGRRDEATVRTVLDRLGPVHAIVAAEVGSEPTAGGPPASATVSTIPASGWGAVEIIAVLLLMLLPFVGPLLGLVFVWASTRWTTRNKLIATAIVVVLLVLPIVLLFAVGAGAATTTGGPVSTP